MIKTPSRSPTTRFDLQFPSSSQDHSCDKNSEGVVGGQPRDPRCSPPTRRNAASSLMSMMHSTSLMKCCFQPDVDDALHLLDEMLGPTACLPSTSALRCCTRILW